MAHVNASKNAKTTSKVKAVNAKTTQIQRCWQRNMSAPKSRSLNYETAGKASWMSVGGRTKLVKSWWRGANLSADPALPHTDFPKKETERT